MKNQITLYVLFLLCRFVCCPLHADQPIFEDNFDQGLSDRWKIQGLSKDEYRIRNGGLELKVKTGPAIKNNPRLEVFLPFTAQDTVIASVEVTLLDAFTEEKERVCLYLIDETGPEFAASKQLIDGKLVYDPGAVEFIGETGSEDDFSKYVEKHQEVKVEKVPLRIISDRGMAHYQVGPFTKGLKYRNFFHSAVNEKAKKKGFALMAYGAPAGKEHWVRFDNFKVYHRN